jgi:hypothetical protein
MPASGLFSSPRCGQARSRRGCPENKPPYGECAVRAEPIARLPGTPSSRVRGLVLPDQISPIASPEGA